MDVAKLDLQMENLNFTILEKNPPNMEIRDLGNIVFIPPLIYPNLFWILRKRLTLTQFSILGEKTMSHISYILLHLHTNQGASW